MLYGHGMGRFLGSCRCTVRWGEEFISRDAAKPHYVPPAARGLPAASTVLLTGCRGSPSQPQPALSLRQPLLGTPLLLESSLFTSPPSWHVFYLHSHSPLRAEAFLHCPQRPVPAPLPVPVSSRAVNASVTERCGGGSGVLNVSLPTSAFSLTA